MKARILLAIAILTTATYTVPGQGYFIFGAGKNSVWYNGQPGGGHTMAGFLWGPADTIGLLGSMGTPTNINFPAYGGWDAILTDPQFRFATNATSGALVAVNVNASGLAIGGINYNSGASFQVIGTVGGSVYTTYCIAWENLYATPSEAAAHGSAVGWSNPFQYTSGANVATLILTFTGSGMQPFGVGIPEPATVALAGLGVTIVMLLRSKFHRCRLQFDA